jgi:RNA polymerase sigma-70 factor (ECF subfamily)
MNQLTVERDQLGMEAVGIATHIITKAAAEDHVRRARAGDVAAFEWIVETFSADMAQVCFVVCGDSALAEEAVAAAWPLAWRRLDSLRETDRLGSWLVSIAANQARQIARSRRRRAVREIPVAAVEEPTTSAEREAQIDLANALARLKPDDRALLALRYVAGFDSNELARATGLSPSGTRARLARLLDRMRTELSDV